MSFLRCSTLRQSARFFPVVAALALASLTTSVSAVDNQDRSVIGKWKFTAALDGSEITSLDEKEAQRLVGQVMTISADRVQFGARKCLPPDLDAERVEPRLYLREQAHASAAKLGLPNPVTVVNLGCTVAFVKAKDRLVIHWDGWFFDARRQR
jgi:hypothetical protein